MNQNFQELLLKLSFYAKWTGIVTLIFGIAQTIIGLIQFGVGTIVGVFLLLAGVSIMKVAHHAKKLTSEKRDDDMIELVQHLVRYLRFQLIVIIFAFITTVVVAITVIHFLSNWEWAIHFIEYAKKVDWGIEVSKRFRLH